MRMPTLRFAGSNSGWGFSPPGSHHHETGVLRRNHQVRRFIGRFQAPHGAARVIDGDVHPLDERLGLDTESGHQHVPNRGSVAVR